jgi:uncharacterized membrane protein (DUF106 family)
MQQNHHEDMQQMKKELDAVKDANSKLQKHLASTVRSHEMEKSDLMKQNEGLKKKPEAATVSVAYIQVYRIIRSYYLWLARVSSERKFPASSGGTENSILGCKRMWQIILFYLDHQ